MSDDLLHKRFASGIDYFNMDFNRELAHFNQNPDGRNF
jgi:hypothetical protein